MTEPQPDEPRRKRALSDLAPPTEKRGERALANALFEALALASSEDPDALTHGFHVYPARMHRAIAAHILEHGTAPGMHIVDPFCGSGTVLVEARVRGLACTGVDLSPLALRLAEVKTLVRDEAGLKRLEAAGQGVVERSKERVRKRDAARAPISKDEAKRFQPHVLRELAVVLEEVRRVERVGDRRALELVLSSLLTKLSERRSETDARPSTRRIGRFVPTEMFGKKCHELVERLRELAFSVRAPGSVTLMQADMRKVRLARAADLILTSPPYGGTYDYARHHDGRMEWLGLDDRALEEAEIGARRRLARAQPKDWDDEVRALLASLSRMLKPRARAYLLMGDGEVGGSAVPAVAQLERLAHGVGLRVLASASAPRKDWRQRGADVMRYEHLIALERGDSTGDRPA